METSKKSIFRRFIETFKPDFLKNNLESLDSGETWKFWFLSNSLITIVIVLFLALGVGVALQEFSKYIQVNYPDARITLENGRLSTNGISEPIYQMSDDKKSLFVFDTKGEKYDASVLDDVSSGVFISSDEIVNKKNLVETNQIKLSQIRKNFSITSQDVQKMKGVVVLALTLIMAVMVWLFLNVLRLVSAFWWALVFWIVAQIMRIESMSYMRTYFAVLNFYWIPFIITAALSFLPRQIPFLTTMIFLIIFIFNYREMQKKESEPEIQIQNA